MKRRARREKRKTIGEETIREGGKKEIENSCFF
jgi:hypothetical protein